MKRLSCFLGTLLLMAWSACSNLNNRANLQKISCGDGSDGAYALLQIDGESDFEAILVQGTVIKPIKKTSRSCLIISEDDRAYRLLIRDSSSRKKTLNMNVDVLPPGLTRFPLSSRTDENNSNNQARCLAAEVNVANELELLYKRNVTDLTSYSMVEVKVRDHEGLIVLQKQVHLGDSVKPLSISLADGIYSLEMRNYDAFDPQALAKATPESCRLVVDKSLPILRLVGDSTLRRAPGSPIQFQVDDRASSDVFLCMKQRSHELIQSDSCTHFKNIAGTYNAPERGAWDVYAYAKDSAGNTSPILHSTLVVYQEALVAEIRESSKALSALEQSNKEFEAFKAYQKILVRAKNLSLVAELRDVYWQILAHFNWLITKNGLIAEEDFPLSFKNNSPRLSPYNDSWTISSIDGKTYVHMAGQTTKELPATYAIDYLSETTVVGIRKGGVEGTILDIIENGVLAQSRILEGSYHQVLFNKKYQQILLLGQTEALLIRADRLDEQRSILLPDKGVPGNLTVFADLASDSQYYYVTIGPYMLRIQAETATIIAEFQDPDLCRITGVHDLGADGLLYGTLPYSKQTSTEMDKCNRAVRLNWTNFDSITTKISARGINDKDIGIGIAAMNGRNFLLAKRRTDLVAIDLSSANQEVYDLKSGEYELLSFRLDSKLGQVSNHPRFRNIIYVRNDDFIYKIELKNQRDGKSLAVAVSAPLSAKLSHSMEAISMTQDPSTILLVSDNKVQTRIFQPADTYLDDQAICGTDCQVAENGDYAVGVLKPGALRWNNQLKQLSKTIEIDFDFIAKAVQTDGHLVLVTRGKDIIRWSPETEEWTNIGKIDWDGEAALRWFAEAQVLAVSSVNATAPKTILIPRDSVPSTYEGLPLDSGHLPVVVLERLAQDSVLVDVINQEGTILNTINTQAVAVDLKFAHSHVWISEGEPVLYSSCDRQLKTFPLYEQKVASVKTLPAGYVAENFLRNGWMFLVGTAAGMPQKALNVKTGQILLALNDEFLYQQGRIDWAGASWNPLNKTLLDVSGERLQVDLKSIFPTSDEFVVGFSFLNNEGWTRNMMVNLDPDWIEAQLKKNPIFKSVRTTGGIP